jgi:hypothetical protein
MLHALLLSEYLLVFVQMIDMASDTTRNEKIMSFLRHCLQTLTRIQERESHKKYAFNILESSMFTCLLRRREGIRR